MIFVNAVYKNLSEETAGMAVEVKGDGAVASNAWLQKANHVFHISCCEEGSWNQQLYIEIAALVDPSDSIVQKSAYSAYHGTTALSDLLLEKWIDETYYAGVASGTCVLASVLANLSLHPLIKPSAVVDCMGYSRPSTHVEALARSTEKGVPCVLSTDI